MVDSLADGLQLPSEAQIFLSHDTVFRSVARDLEIVDGSAGREESEHPKTDEGAHHERLADAIAFDRRLIVRHHDEREGFLRHQFTPNA